MAVLFNPGSQRRQLFLVIASACRPLASMVMGARTSKDSPPLVLGFATTPLTFPSRRMRSITWVSCLTSAPLLSSVFQEHVIERASLDLPGHRRFVVEMPGEMKR